MGNNNSLNSIKKINFEHMQRVINDNENIIINTLDDNEQDCLIEGTTNSQSEVTLINKCLNTMKTQHIIVYGKNNNDEKIFIKHKQLINLGFTNISIYIGGLFEWMLLQEVYGELAFPTTSSELDILRYK